MDSLFAQLEKLAPRGYGAWLHIRNAEPLLKKSTYPASWIAVYKSQSFFLRDPTVVWGFGNQGTLRWSEVEQEDPCDMFRKAELHGLKFGAVCSCGPVHSRTIVEISRADREADDGELAALTEITHAMHAMIPGRKDLTKPQAEALRLVSLGLRHSEAAEKLGITESAFKARLQSARSRLGARTTSEAVRKAREYHML